MVEPPSHGTPAPPAGAVRSLDRRAFLRAGGLCALAPALRLALLDGEAGEAAWLRAFQAKPAAVQDKVLATLRGELARSKDPWLRGLLAAVDRGRALESAKVPAGWLARPPHKEGPWRYAGLPFALQREYLWGHRVVRRVEGRPALSAGEGRERVALKQGSPAEVLLGALRGIVPEADLALAAFQHELDTQRGADQLQSFLEAWRNGQESFYSALDRTAGTGEAVFFFDAMLDEFTRRFGLQVGRGPDRATALNKAHASLRLAFLTYRQYRALREVVAFTLVLPPDVALPGHLARYEQKVDDQLSMREDVLILLHLDEDSPDHVLKLVLDTAPPLPDPLWSTNGTYEGLHALQQAFARRVAERLRAAQEGSTAAWLAAARAAGTRVAGQVRAGALAALTDAGIKP